MRVVAHGKIHKAAAVQAFVVKACEADAGACPANEAEQSCKSREQFEIYNAGDLFAAAPAHEAEHAEEQRDQVVGIHFKNVILRYGVEDLERLRIVFEYSEEKLGPGFALKLAHSGVNYYSAAHFGEFDKEGAFGVGNLFWGENITDAREQGGDKAEGYADPFVYSAHCVNVHRTVGAMVCVAGCKINIRMRSTAKQKCYTFAAPKGNITYSSLAQLVRASDC